MRTYLSEVALALAAGLAVSACGQGGEAPELIPPTSANAVHVRVTNENRADMMVYLSSSNGARTKLGLVRAGQTSTLRLPGRIVTGPWSAYLEAEPFGWTGDTHVSSAVMDLGKTLEWSIGATPAISRLSVLR